MNPSQWLYNGWLALLVVSALLLWQAKSAVQLWQLSKQSTNIPVVHKIPASPHLVTISQYHLFGTYVPKSVDNDEVSLSSLNFTVIGIFLATPPDKSSALMDLGEGTSKTYKVGDTLQGDVKLYKISKDAVVIEREGHYESIPLDKETLQFEQQAPPLPLDPHD